jgi:hypothetical protein
MKFCDIPEFRRPTRTEPLCATACRAAGAWSSSIWKTVFQYTPVASIPTSVTPAAANRVYGQTPPRLERGFTGKESHRANRGACPCSLVSHQRRADARALHSRICRSPGSLATATSSPSSRRASPMGSSRALKVSAQRPLATSKTGAGQARTAGFAYPRQTKSRVCKPSATTAFSPPGVVRLAGGEEEGTPRLRADTRIGVAAVLRVAASDALAAVPKRINFSADRTVMLPRMRHYLGASKPGQSGLVQSRPCRSRVSCATRLSVRSVRANVCSAMSGLNRWRVTACE